MPKIENLINQQFLDNIDNLVNEIISNDDVGSAQGLLKGLNSAVNNEELKRKYPDIYKKYLLNKTKASFICLPLIDKEDVVNAFSDFKVIYSLENYDVILKLDYFLSSILDLKERDTIKQKIKDVLLKNSSKLTQNDILIGKILQKPTIANWLKDYYSKLGLNPVDNVKLRQYLINDENTKTLSSEDRNNLEILLTLFEKLKTSSSDIKNVEDKFTVILPNGKVGSFVRGNIEEPEVEVEKLFEAIKKELDLENAERRKTEAPNPSPILSAQSAEVNVSSLSTPTISKQSSIENKPTTEKVIDPAQAARIAEMQKMVEQYPAESFERKALEQEIERMKKAV
ncbi:MAG: hypothetical protein MUF50_00540 [Planctomycetes bacterium]|jgi:hypothetical protein|nr:hypothetical protein [Planctomycetota bacterium]